ncbi:MAG TPA: permease-like cell division protein FtsX [Mycobacteriales bacterium]|nr:permease-like cell division protein FtsX [Mycobacteriales bacterium]
MPPTTRAAVTVLAALGTLTAGCGGGSAPAASTPPGVRTPPSIAAFLRLPVATPTACPSNVSGSSDGRRSPWSGHVDVSIFLKPGDTPAQIAEVGKRLHAALIVEKTYFESQAEAYAEFQRLYTCSAEVPRSDTPASYRLVLELTSTVGQRNALVARLLKDPAVDTASCDPALPCTDVVNSASAAPRR